MVGGDGRHKGHTGINSQFSYFVVNSSRIYPPRVMTALLLNCDLYQNRMVVVELSGHALERIPRAHKSLLLTKLEGTPKVYHYTMQSNLTLRRN